MESGGKKWDLRSIFWTIKREAGPGNGILNLMSLRLPRWCWQLADNLMISTDKIEVLISAYLRSRVFPTQGSYYQLQWWPKFVQLPNTEQAVKPLGTCKSTLRMWLQRAQQPKILIFFMTGKAYRSRWYLHSTFFGGFPGNL